MQHFQFQTVGNIISGLGSISELKTVLTEKNYKRLLLVTDAGILQQQLHQPILEISGPNTNRPLYGSTPVRSRSPFLYVIVT